VLYQTGELLEQRLVGKVDCILLKRTRLEGIHAPEEHHAAVAADT